MVDNISPFMISVVFDVLVTACRGYNVRINWSFVQIL